MHNYSRQQFHEGFQWGPFILGILSLILSFLAFNHPMVSILSVAFFFAVGAILKGIYELLFRRALRQFVNYNSTLLIIIGIVDLLIGVFFLFSLSGTILALPYLFAFWLIFDSIGTLLTARPIRNFSNTQFWFTILVGVLGIIIGFLLLSNPFSTYVAIATLVGVYFMLYGILNIVYAF